MSPMNIHTEPKKTVGRIPRAIQNHARKKYPMLMLANVQRYFSALSRSMFITKWYLHIWSNLGTWAIVERQLFFCCDSPQTSMNERLFDESNTTFRAFHAPIFSSGFIVVNLHLLCRSICRSFAVVARECHSKRGTRSKCASSPPLQGPIDSFGLAAHAIDPTEYHVTSTDRFVT